MVNILGLSRIKRPIRVGDGDRDAEHSLSRVDRGRHRVEVMFLIGRMNIDNGEVARVDPRLDDVRHSVICTEGLLPALPKSSLAGCARISRSSWYLTQYLVQP